MDRSDIIKTKGGNGMRVVIDRFEGPYAVVELEDLSTANIARAALPADAAEGDVVEILIDREETERRGRQTDALMDEILRKQASRSADDRPRDGEEETS